MAHPSDVMQALQQRNIGRLRALVKAQPELARAQVGGMSALLLACYLRNPEAIEVLRASGGLTSIHEAAVLDDEPFAAALLDADPKLPASLSADGFSPLHLAAHFGSLRVLRLLLERGAVIASVGANPMANTPLHGAAAGNQPEVMEILLAKAHPVDVRDSGGNTPLMVAAANGNDAAVRVLLAAGANRTGRNKAGRTALQLAQDKGERLTARLLEG